MTEPDVPRRSAPAHSAHRRRGIRSWWQAVVEWRNWRLPVKVGAVLVVPAIAAVTLGAIQVAGDIGQADSLSTIQQLIQLRADLIPLTTDLQTERWVVAQRLGTGAPFSDATLHQTAKAVDDDAATITDLGHKLLDPSSPAGIRLSSLIGQFGGLPALRQQAATGTGDVVTVIYSYGVVINAALDLDQALAPQLTQPQLTGLALSLNDLEIAQEQVRVQEAIITVGLTRGTLLATELKTAGSSDELLTDRLNSFQIVATASQLALYQQPNVAYDLNIREQIAQQVVSEGEAQLVGGAGQGNQSLGVAPSAWISASDAAAIQLSGISAGLVDNLRTTSATLQDQASTSAGVESVILFAILLLAIAVGVIVGRHLLRSLGILRRTALDVAEYQLPEVVAAIDRGETSDLAIEPVPVHTHEELGQLARAFDAVHGQAVRSAVGQATLRSNLRSVFVNLSRRSQSLVERQLRLMERLEHNEEDPQQLANLFKLDHLATRMRRNNENLMVLSGDDPALRSGGPLSLADVVRAAVSEIEHYQRVVVRSTPSADILGYAAGDLTRLVAELLDNATSFSPPQAQVLVGGRSFPDGSVRIEIRDEGIGITAAELIEANAKLDAGDSQDVPVSRQMGLYVVGRLARRHSIRVVLEAPPDGGLLAIVQVPAELVKLGPTPRESPALPIEQPLADLRAAAGPAVPATNGVPSVPSNGNGSRPLVTNGHGPTDLFGMPADETAAVSGDLVSEWRAFSGTAIRDIESDLNLAPTNFTWFIPEFAPDDAEPAAPPRPAPPRPAPAPVPAPTPTPITTSVPTPAPPAAPAQTADESSYAYTAVGLPRRVPRSHAVPSLVDRPAANVAQPKPVPAPTAAPTGRRNPSRARGFLNDYQSGIRQGARSRGETAAVPEPMDNGNGEGQ